VKLAGNGALRVSLSLESHHLLITSEALVSTDELLAFSRDQVREIGRRLSW
jgi:hypothetical protein